MRNSLAVIRYAGSPWVHLGTGDSVYSVVMLAVDVDVDVDV